MSLPLHSIIISYFQYCIENHISSRDMIKHICRELIMLMKHLKLYIEDNIIVDEIKECLILINNLYLRKGSEKYYNLYLNSIKINDDNRNLITDILMKEVYL